MPEQPPKPMLQVDSEHVNKLRQASRAFEVGDFATVRRLCDELATASDPDVVGLAAKLRERTQVDRLQVVILVGCALLFAYVVWRFAF